LRQKEVHRRVVNMEINVVIKNNVLATVVAADRSIELTYDQKKSTIAALDLKEDFKRFALECLDSREIKIAL